MLRRESATGSIRSSPSTSTVYTPVIEPLSVRPARSRRRGRIPKTEGGYPFVAGGSPAVSPTSRWAVAKRVTESIISNTSRPVSRKYSAIVVATRAERTRIKAG